MLENNKKIPVLNFSGEQCAAIISKPMKAEVLRLTLPYVLTKVKVLITMH